MRLWRRERAACPECDGLRKQVSQFRFGLDRQRQLTDYILDHIKRIERERCEFERELRGAASAASVNADKALFRVGEFTGELP